MFYKDQFFCLIKDPHETKEKFNQRGWFIVSQKPKTIDEFKQMETLSRIWINMKYYKCGYEKEITDKIRELESNVI